MKITVEAFKNDGRSVKCPRCYHWHGAIENFGHYPGDKNAKEEFCHQNEKLCDDCQETILTHFPNHKSVSGIKEALKRQKEKYTRI